MKKYLIPLLFLVCGCNDSKTIPDVKMPPNNYTNYSHDVYEVTYKGHDYIVFKGNEGFAHGMFSGTSASHAASEGGAWATYQNRCKDL